MEQTVYSCLILAFCRYIIYRICIIDVLLVLQVGLSEMICDLFIVMTIIVYTFQENDVWHTVYYKFVISFSQSGAVLLIRLMTH